MSVDELLGKAPGVPRRIFNQHLPIAFLAMWIIMVLLLIMPSAASMIGSLN